ncbi:MAG: hypothetical protein ACE14P_13035 [Methanotrichaceae archaeon]
MIQLALEMILLLLIVAIIILGLIFHHHYFVRVTTHVKDTSDKSFLEKDLRAALRVPQGPNFYTVMIFSWSIFLIAFALQFFLTPNILSAWSFFEFPQLASDNLGLAYFGIAIVIIPGLLVALFIPRCYSYCLIPGHLKQMTLMAPAFSLISILCSVYLGTIYPEINSVYWYLGYIALFASLVVMLAPIVMAYIEEMRVRS